MRPRRLLDFPAPFLVLGIATAAGLFFTAQIYFSWATLHGNANWWQSMYWAFGDWFEWALLSPAIFWVCRRFPFTRSAWPLSVGVHLAAAVFFSVVHAALCSIAALLQGIVTGPAVTFAAEFRKVLSGLTPFNLAVCGAIVCAWHVWRHYRDVRARDAELTELRSRLAEAQLFALRMQLNPHFLYNTLNAVSSLMLTDVPAANRMLSRLGGLLRTTLETEARTEIALTEELAHLRGYLEIEEIRFGDRLRVQIEPEPGALEAAVPNFILQPLIENALRHAIEHRETGGEIALRARRTNGSLILEVADNGPDPETASTIRSSSDRATHIGLHNIRERLEKLYGPGQRLDLAANPRGGLTASITIPFRPLPVPSSAAS